MPNLFIIAGCNGAGKTTASSIVLPELLKIKEFVNADEIARGISPFNAEAVSIEAGKIMLKRINELIDKKESFGFETTLASRSFTSLIVRVHNLGYRIHLIFFWLDSPLLAIERVRARVAAGGHNIPTEVIIRRYFSGIKNLFNLYQQIVDYLLIIDNSSGEPVVVGEKWKDDDFKVLDSGRWGIIKNIVSNEKG